MASRRRHGDIVKYLHQAGADLNVRDKYGNTAVMYAAQEGHGDVVEYLHGAGADIYIMDNAGNTAVIMIRSKYGWTVDTFDEGSW